MRTSKRTCVVLCNAHLPILDIEIGCGRHILELEVALQVELVGECLAAY